MSIARVLRDYLDDHEVQYELVDHPATGDSMHAAAAAHVPGECLAKAVLLEDDGGYLMAVLPSTRHVHLGLLHKQFERSVGLATEVEIGALFADCDPGAMPPVGAAYGIDTIVDDTLTEQPDIYFEAGDHHTLVHLSGPAFNELMKEAGQGSFSVPA
ncbi:MAG: aminoacyl-tRNA deacylase [Gammaproteobacteria bacterium]